MAHSTATPPTQLTCLLIGSEWQYTLWNPKHNHHIEHNLNPNENPYSPTNGRI